MLPPPLPLALAPAPLCANTTRNAALSQKTRQQTCAPRADAPFHGLGVAGPSALFGTGPSFTDVVSETEGGDGDGEEGSKKKKKKKSAGDKEKVRLRRFGVHQSSNQS